LRCRRASGISTRLRDPVTLGQFLSNSWQSFLVCLSYNPSEGSCRSRTRHVSLDQTVGKRIVERSQYTSTHFYDAFRRRNLSVLHRTARAHAEPLPVLAEGVPMTVEKDGANDLHLT
jgi:hypothetical protein